MSELERLDAISRERELTYTESLRLEREVHFEAHRKLPKGLTRALARRGVKRDMSRFRKPKL